MNKPSIRFGSVASLFLASLALGAPFQAQTATSTGTPGVGGITPKGTTGPTSVPPGGVTPGASGDGDTSSFNPFTIPGASGKQLGRTIVGYFNNDDWLDTVVMVDDQPVALSGRGVYLSYEKPWGSMLSLDTFPGAGPSGQDAVVFTDDLGLHFAWWDFATKSFMQTLIDSNLWANAVHVRVAQTDGTGRFDIFGIDANRQALLRMSTSASASPVFTPMASLVVDSELFSFTVLEWDGTGPSEVALLIDNELEVRSLDGTLIQQWLGLPIGGWLAKIEQGYLPNDRLTWVTPSVVDPVTQLVSQSVFTVDIDGIDVAINSSGAYVSSAVGADWDGDGDDDLIVGYGASLDLVVLINERSASDPTAESFPSSAQTYLLPIGSPNTTNMGQVANVVVGDFDNDGDLDGALAVAATSEFRIGLNNSMTVGDDTPQVLKVRYRVTSGSPTGEARLRIAKPIINPIGAELQIVLWRQDDIKGVSDPQPVSVDNFKIYRWPADVTIQIPEVGQYSESAYYLEMRFGRLKPGMQKIGYREASLGGFTLSPLITQTLLSVTGSGSPVLFTPVGDIVNVPGQVGLLGGAYVPNLRVPPTLGFNYQ